MARRSRHEAPAWADRFDATPEGFDAQHVESEVRRHMREGTDPDTIDDPDVRDAFLQRLNEEAERDDIERERAAGGSRHRANPRSSRAGGRVSGGAGKRSPARFSHPLHWGSGSRGHVVGKPTLQLPRRLSLNDSTGFAFGLVLYALGLSYIRYGAAGPRSWLAAKFINRPNADLVATVNASPAVKRAARQVAGDVGKTLPTSPVPRF